MKYIALFIILASFTVSTCMTSCGSDEPEVIEKKNHRPGESGETDSSEDNEDGSHTGGQPGENTEQSPIVGSWADIKEGSRMIFTAEGSYESTQQDGTLLESGEYTYDGFKQRLYISIDNGNEVTAKTYKCIIDGDIMTLNEKSGKKKELRKEQK